MLLTFEGLDGSGKTTQARLLVERLREEGYSSILVREPGGTPLSERIRELLLDRSLSVVPFAELLLFSAARAQLVAEVIRPSLQEGEIVVCDRFYDSTTAYQGGGRQVADIDWLQAFHLQVTGGLVPDRTYLIEVPVEVALERKAGQTPDRMEAAGRNFYERVAATYRLLAEREPQRFVRIDGTQSIEHIHAAIWEDVRRLLRQREEQV